MGQQQQQEEEEEEETFAFDLRGLRTPKGLLLGGELVLCGAVVGLLAPPAPPTLAPALLQTLGVAAALGGRLLRPPPRLPHAACLDLLRAVSGAAIFFVTALVSLASSRDALAATTFTFSLVLAFAFAFDAFVTCRTKMAAAGGQDADTT